MRFPKCSTPRSTNAASANSYTWCGGLDTKGPMKKCLGYQLWNWSMPPRLFQTSIMLIQTSLVHLISFLLNSVSLRYPETNFYFLHLHTFPLYNSVSLLHILRNKFLSKNTF